MGTGQGDKFFTLDSSIEEAIEPVWSRCARTSDELSRAALGLAQRALLSGRPELVGGVRPLLPPAGLDAMDASGLTALMKAALAGDDQIVAVSTLTVTVRGTSRGPVYQCPRM